MKICCTCKREFDESCFYKNNGKKDGLASACKQCEAEKKKDHYLKYKQEYVSRAKKNKKNHWSWYKDLKSLLVCSKCGESHVACLHFHHVNPNEKEYSVSEMARRGFAKQRILDEIKKCKVLCSNCHAKLHFEMSGWSSG